MILIAGLPGSGKTTVSDMMKEFDLPVVSMGDIVREQALRQGRPTDIRSMNEFMVELRKKFGEGIVAELTIEKLKKIPDRKVVIDGLRSVEEYEIFEKAADEVVLIVVDARTQNRFERLSKRGRPDDPKRISDLRTRDRTELSVGLSELLSRNGIRIENDGNIESLRGEVHSILRKLAIIQ